MKAVVLAAMHRPDRPDANRGFTLIEVILSLTLTAMLLGLLSTGMFVVARDWGRATDAFDEALDESLAILQIERALQGAFPHSYTNLELLSRAVYFRGEADSLSWVTTVSPQRQPGLTAWELTAIEDEGVFLKTVPAFSDDPTPRLIAAEAALLIPDYELEFSYLYQDLSEARVWTEAWSGEVQLRLPEAIYLRLVPSGDQTAANTAIEVLAAVRAATHRSIQPRMGLQGPPGQ